MSKNPVIDKYGNKEWYNNNSQLHREDGPAIKWANGDKAWYINGKRHRKDGPAIEDVDGYKVWYINDQRHREDGPAMEWTNGNKYWYLNGEKLTEKEFLTRKKSQEPVNISNYLEDFPDLHI